jgi:hypothetical protein
MQISSKRVRDTLTSKESVKHLLRGIERWGRKYKNTFEMRKELRANITSEG